MFFRFPNLEEVYRSGYTNLYMFSEFDDDVCEDLLRSCPKLRTFKAMSCSPDLVHLLKLRRVATEIVLLFNPGTTYEENVALYITNFKRLTSLCIDSCSTLDTFEKFMPVFEQLPNLTELDIDGAQQDKHKFAERYLTSRTKIEQEVLLERLSKVTNLVWRNSSGICVNAITFITNYLTGLKSLELDVNFANSTINRQQYQLFFTSMLDLFSSTVECYIIAAFRINDLSEYLALILRKVYQQTSKNSEKKTLKIVVHKHWDREDENIAEVRMRRTSNKPYKNISIEIKGKHSLGILMANVFPKAPSLNGVDYFEYKFLDDTDHENLLGVTIE